MQRVEVRRTTALVLARPLHGNRTGGLEAVDDVLDVAAGEPWLPRDRRRADPTCHRSLPRAKCEVRRNGLLGGAELVIAVDAVEPLPEVHSATPPSAGLARPSPAGASVQRSRSRECTF